MPSAALRAAVLRPSLSTASDGVAEPARPVVIDAREARLASPRWLTLVSLAAALGFAGFGLGYSLLHALPTLYWDGWGYSEVLLGAHESGSLADWAREIGRAHV